MRILGRPQFLEMSIQNERSSNEEKISSKIREIQKKKQGAFQKLLEDVQISKFWISNLGKVFANPKKMSFLIVLWMNFRQKNNFKKEKGKILIDFKKIDKNPPK